MSTILEVENLHKDFTLHILGGKTIRALDSVSFEMDEGESLGSPGNSGVGRYALMRCIHRLYLARGAGVAMRTTRGESDWAGGGAPGVWRGRKPGLRPCPFLRRGLPGGPAVEVVAE